MRWIPWFILLLVVSFHFAAEWETESLAGKPVANRWVKTTHGWERTILWNYNDPHTARTPPGNIHPAYAAGFQLCALALVILACWEESPQSVRAKSASHARIARPHHARNVVNQNA